MLALVEASPLDDMGRARLEVMRARQTSWSGDDRDAPGLFLRAAQRFAALDSDLAATTYLQALAAVGMAGNFARGVTIGDIARAASSCAMPAAPATKDWLLAGLARFTVEGPSAAAPLLRRALEAAPGSAKDNEPMHWLGFQQCAASALWDYETLHRLVVQHVPAARDVGALQLLSSALNTLALVSAFEGDFEHAASLLSEATQIVEASGTGALPWARAIVAAWKGEADATGTIEDLITRALSVGSGQALKCSQWASAMLNNGTMQYDGALAVALEADRQPWEWGAQFYVHELIEAAVRCGERDIADATLERLAESTSASGTDWALGIQRRCEALLANDTNAEALYREAIAHLGRTRLRPETARAHLLYGEWLRRENRRIDARAELQTAYDMFLSMGINAFAERARHELLLTGATVRKRVVESYAELTPQELEVSRLAVDGMTNAEIGARLFISVRTVEWHLRKVFTKLGVSSRRELKGVLPGRVSRAD
jgi:DNA-binding CsgD family transcriptional regulator